MKNALLSKSNPCDVHWRKCRHFLSQGHFLNWDIYFKKISTDSKMGLSFAVFMPIKANQVYQW